MSCSTTILDRIVARKRQEVAVRSAQRALEELYEVLTDQVAGSRI